MKKGGMPVSIQLVPPETRKWSHKCFPHQITQCRPPDCRCAASTRQPPIGAKPPAAASCLSRHRPRTPPSRRTTQPQNAPSCGSRCRQSMIRREMGRSPFTSMASRTYQGDENLPWPSNLLLAVTEEINKFLSSIFWQELDESGAKNVLLPDLLPHSSWQALRPGP